MAIGAACNPYQTRPIALGGKTGWSLDRSGREPDPRGEDQRLDPPRPPTRRAANGSCQPQAERLNASIRAKVEHPFHVVKNLLRHKKVRYKGLAKNEAQLLSLFCLANLVIAKRQLLVLHARGAS